MPVCNVSGTLILPTGELAENLEVVIKRREKNVFAQAAGVIVPESFCARTNDNGLLEFAALPGNYSAEILIEKTRVVTFLIAVPFSASANLADIINVAEPPTPTSPFRVPSGQPGQVITYDSQGRPIAADASMDDSELRQMIADLRARLEILESGTTPISQTVWTLNGEPFAWTANDQPFTWTGA